MLQHGPVQVMISCQARIMRSCVSRHVYCLHADEDAFRHFSFYRWHAAGLCENQSQSQSICSVHVYTWRQHLDIQVTKD